MQKYTQNVEMNSKSSIRRPHCTFLFLGGLWSMPLPQWLIVRHWQSFSAIIHWSCHAQKFTMGWNIFWRSILYFYKVHIFWEGHKILRNLHQLFVLCTASQIIGGDFANFCGLLRIYELYVLKIFSSISNVQYDVSYEPNVCKNDSKWPMFQENAPSR